MVKIFWIIKSLLPILPNSKTIINQIYYFYYQKQTPKCPHFLLTQIYNNQEQNLTTKIMLRLNSFFHCKNINDVWSTELFESIDLWKIFISDFLIICDIDIICQRQCHLKRTWKYSWLTCIFIGCSCKDF